MEVLPYVSLNSQTCINTLTKQDLLSTAHVPFPGLYPSLPLLLFQVSVNSLFDVLSARSFLLWPTDDPIYSALRA